MVYSSTRYALSALIAPIGLDRLYKGEDLTLKRSVLIYAVPILHETSVETYIQRLESATHGITNRPFLHILDMELQQEQIHVVMNHKPGCSLQPFIQHTPPSVMDALTMIAEFGRDLLNGEDGTTMNFSLAPANIWITDNRQLNVINSWDAAVHKMSLAKRLSLLLYQLLTRTEHIPTDSDSFGIQLSWSLQHGPPDQIEEIVTVVSHAWTDQMTAASFVQCLQQLQSDWPHQTTFTASPASAIAHLNEPVLPDDEEVEEEEEEEATSQNAPLLRFSRKVLVGLTASVIGLVVFVGVLIVMIEFIDLKWSPSTSTATTNQAQQPQSTVQPTPSQKPPSPKPSTSSPDSESTVLVPSLAGLTQAAAEQQALAMGLRYTYYLEVHDQAAGTVFRQEPAANELVSKGSRVTFWISKGR